MTKVTRELPLETPLYKISPHLSPHVESCPNNDGKTMLMRLRATFTKQHGMNRNVGTWIASLSKWVLPAAAVAGVIALSASLATVPLLFRSMGSAYEPIGVAFLGNSIQYYNDYPRFMEVISGGSIKQNSCLHESSSLADLVDLGNGMIKKFNTTNAVINGTRFYDWGACTSHQLILGYDRYLYQKWVYLNETSRKSSYTGPIDDGLNPCLVSDEYKKYVTTNFLKHPAKWDFVVMNDGLQSPARYHKRQTSISAIEKTYVEWFQKSGAIPVFLYTYAYWTSFQNMDGLVDVPTFTSLLYEGYREYAELLGSYLSAEQQPRIAPVGTAFLVVWEEDSAMWEKLFHYDDIHPSPHGTFLQGCVLHCTLFGRMPDKDVAFPDDMQQLFSSARRMQPPTHHRKPWPTQDEAAYLYDVAKRVTIHGYIPSSFVEFKNGESAFTDDAVNV